MKKTIPFITAVFFVTAALSCDFPQSVDGGKGYLTVLMSGAASDGLYGSSRSVLSNNDISSFTYKLVFTGPGGIIERTVQGGSASVSLEPGEWTVQAEARNSSGVLAGTGSATVVIAPGQQNSVALKMYVNSGYAAALTDIYIHSENELREYITLYDGGAPVTFHLENDITASGSPVGDFYGIFDGHGHTVTLNIVVTGSQAGLFKTNYGTVKNLKLEGAVNADFDNSPFFAGAAAAVNSGTIRNVASVASVTALQTSTGFADFRAGGITGDNDGGTIGDCSAGGTVTGRKPAGGANPVFGGVAGRNTGVIDRCYAWGKVITDQGSPYTGGITGYNNGGAVNYCVALNSKVENPNPGNIKGRIAGEIFGGGTFTGDYAYEDMQVGDPAITIVLTDRISNGKHGADIPTTATLQDPGSDLTFWNRFTMLNWPPFLSGPSTSEPPAGSSPWYWGKTIAIPENTENPLGVPVACVPVLWFE